MPDFTATPCEPAFVSSFSFEGLGFGETLRLVIENVSMVDTKAAAEWYFTVESLPRGMKPEYMRDIVTTKNASVPIPRFGADGRNDASYMASLNLNQKELTEKKPDLVILGDSIMHNFPGSILERRLGKYRVSNQAYGGDQTEHQAWRTLNLDYSAHNPKCALVMIGINNIADPLYTVDDVADGIRIVIESIKSRSPRTKILLIGILPSGTDLKSGFNAERIPLVNALISKLADGKTVFYADITRQMAEPSGRLDRKIFVDGTHLGNAGFERFCDLVTPLLDKISAE